MRGSENACNVLIDHWLIKASHEALVFRKNLETPLFHTQHAKNIEFLTHLHSLTVQYCNIRLGTLVIGVKSAERRVFIDCFVFAATAARATLPAQYHAIPLGIQF